MTGALAASRTTIMQQPLLCKMRLESLPAAVFGATSIDAFIQSVSVDLSASSCRMTVETSVL
jgi:hypothetical protein